MRFNAEQARVDIILFIRDFFKKSGGKTAVVGLSGGKDSTIVAALCAEAIGRKNTVGVIIPNGEMADIGEAKEAAELYCGDSYVFNLSSMMMCMNTSVLPLSTEQARINLPARMRMCILYYVAQSLTHGRVANTCNLSEDYVGWATRYGDTAGDFAPLHNYTVQEVKAIGRTLGVPEKLVEKVPSDGLCGKTDEEGLGFSYEVLDRYIRTGECDDTLIKERIDTLHERNLFKLMPIPAAPNRYA